jgi:hypothetical protein
MDGMLEKDHRDLPELHRISLQQMRIELTNFNDDW